MQEITEESIEKEMEGINETDLQNRLKKLYEEKQKLENKKSEGNNNDEKITEKLKILEENINLSIKVYERNLPLRYIERAKRSAGMYETETEISNSIKREKESIEKEELEK